MAASALRSASMASAMLLTACSNETCSTISRPNSQSRISCTRITGAAESKSSELLRNLARRSFRLARSTAGSLRLLRILPLEWVAPCLLLASTRTPGLASEASMRESRAGSMRDIRAVHGDCDKHPDRPAQSFPPQPQGIRPRPPQARPIDWTVLSACLLVAPDCCTGSALPRIAPWPLAADYPEEVDRPWQML